MNKPQKTTSAKRLFRLTLIFILATAAASIFDEEGGLVERLELGAGDTLILLNGGHGYEILEDNTQVLEVKNGPYPGAEADRRRIEWPKP